MALLAADPGLCAAVGLGNCIEARKRSSQVGPNLFGLFATGGGARPNEFGPTDTSTIGGRSKGPIAEITAHTVRRTERDRTVPCSNPSARAPLSFPRSTSPAANHPGSGPAARPATAAVRAVLLPAPRAGC